MTLLRPLLVAILLTAAIAVSSASAGSVCSTSCFQAPAGSGALLVFNGHGWGHGVGMSQYGAYGYAQHGSTYRQILAHYYPGTKLGPAPVSTIRVLLADKKKTLKLSSEVAFSVRDGAGAKTTLPPGALQLTPALKIDGKALVPPLQILPGHGGPLTLTRPYRGWLDVDVVDGRLRAVNVV